MTWNYYQRPVRQFWFPGMSPENPTTGDRLGRRVALVGEMVGELAFAQAALLACNWQQIEIHNTRLDELCRLLAMVDDKVPEKVPENTAREPARQDAEHLSASAELIALARQARHLNRVNAALLRRIERRLGVLSFLLSRSAPTYSLPTTRIHRHLVVVPRPRER